MKVKATALALALAGIAAAGSVQAGVLSESASAFSYDSVGINYTETEHDTSDVARDGFGVEGSLSVSPNFFVTGELDFVEDQVEREYTNTRVGAGYHRDLGISVPTDFVAEAGVSALHETLPNGDEDRTFLWDATVGARTSLGIQGLDATAYVGVAENWNSLDFSLKYGVSADYFVTPEVTVGASYDIHRDGAGIDAFEEDLETVSFGVKYHL